MKRKSKNSRMIIKKSRHVSKNAVKTTSDDKVYTTVPTVFPLNRTLSGFSLHVLFFDDLAIFEDFLHPVNTFLRFLEVFEPCRYIVTKLITKYRMILEILIHKVQFLLKVSHSV